MDDHDLVTTLNDRKRLDGLTLEQRMVTGLDGQRQTLTDWAREQGHHPARVHAAWAHGLLFVRGRTRHGRLRVTLRRDLDPAHLNTDAKKTPGGQARSEFKEPRALRVAQAEAERAEHEQDDPGAADRGPGHDEHDNTMEAA